MDPNIRPNGPRADRIYITAPNSALLATLADLRSGNTSPNEVLIVGKPISFRYKQLHGTGLTCVYPLFWDHMTSCGVIIRGLDYVTGELVSYNLSDVVEWIHGVPNGVKSFVPSEEIVL